MIDPIYIYYKLPQVVEKIAKFIGKELALAKRDLIAQQTSFAATSVFIYDPHGLRRARFLKREVLFVDYF